ncbi:MAG: PQQ-binding-like beta-propeller repeat protein [Planctomycetota bacterium]
MRRQFLRAGCVATIAAAAAVAPLATSRSQDESSENGANRVQLPVNEDAVGRLDMAQQAAKNGDLDRAIELVRSVIDPDIDSRRSNSIIFVDDSPSANAAQPKLKRFIGVIEKANAFLRSLPKEARDKYRAKYDTRAQAAFRAALESDDSVRDLVKACDRYALASGAAEALESAADRSFAKGELERARRLYDRLLRDHKTDLKKPGKVREKLLLASVPLGRKADVERLLKEMTAEDKDAKVHVNGVARSREQILELTLKNQAAIRGESSDSKPFLNLPRGDTANRASFGRAIRVGPSRFRPRSFDEGALDGGRYPSRMDRGADPGPARHLPLLWNDTIFVSTADRLRGFALDGTEKPKITLVGINYTDDNPNVQFASAIERGILIAPHVERAQDEQSFRGIPIKVKIPMRKLGGFELERWRWKWDHTKDLVNTELAKASFPVAPVCTDGDCFVAAFKIEGFVNCYAAAFNAETGAVRWSSWIASGQVEQTMFGEHAREPLCAPVAVGDGLVFDATQMGCVAALDADTGRLRWVNEYDQILVNSAKGYYPDPRNIIWENNAPVYDVASNGQGVVVVAPMDSEFYYGLDALSGAQLWRCSNRKRDTFEPNAELRYVVGASDGRVVVSGGRRVLCHDMATGKLKWKVELDRRLVAGRGVIAAGKVYVPTSETIEVINLATGTLEASQAVPLGGNVVVVGDTIVVASDSQVGAFDNKRADKNTSNSKDF